MKMLARCLLLWIGSLLMTSVCFAETLEAFLDKTEVAYGEPIELKIVYDGTDVSSVRPDLDDLRRDFSIYSSSSSVQTSIINGKSETRKSWSIGLMPRKEGKIIIPEISVGNNKTSALEINVLSPDSSVEIEPEKQTNQAQSTPDVYVELTLDQPKPYVQQEVNAVLTIHDKKGIQLSREPLFFGDDQWIIRSLGQPAVDYKNNNEREIKFYYALFPQKSGVIRIPEVQIDGYYESFTQNSTKPSTIGDLFRLFEIDIDHMFGVQKPISVRTKSEKVEVQPIASGFENLWWLPAKNAAMAAKWDMMKPEFKVGQAVSREITFVAQGVDEAQMPEISLNSISEVKLYPEKPQISSFVDDGFVSSKLVMRVVYIPQKSGEIMIPAIEIPWFNTETQQMEKAVVPAQKITVKPDGSSLADDKQISAQIKETDSFDTAMKMPKKEPARPQNNLWLWLGIVGAFLAGMMISFCIMRPKVNRALTSKHENALKQIRQALERQDYRALRDSLLAFAKQTFPQEKVVHIQDLCALLHNEEFSAQMNLLNGILYADQTAQLDADLILSVLKNAAKRKNDQPSEKEPLPKLYK
ncbi:MAG: BatD family protein [Alphaproteobacteria bacterium]|nr:BatD family protein [Alphaproteobacteria bacterium]